MLESKNTKKQGDIGLGRAISWFVQNHYTVSLPLTDSQEYDLIVEKYSILYRVQVKTTRYKRRNYEVSLTVKGGNKSNYTTKKFNHCIVEYVFILTEEDVIYLIPTNELNDKQTLSLGEEYNKYKHNCVR